MNRINTENKEAIHTSPGSNINSVRLPLANGWYIWPFDRLKNKGFYIKAIGCLVYLWSTKRQNSEGYILKPAHPPRSLNSCLVLMSWLSPHPSSYPHHLSFYLSSPQHYYHHCPKCCRSQSPLQHRKMYAKDQCATDTLNYTSPLSSWSWEWIWPLGSRCQLCSHMKQRERERARVACMQDHASDALMFRLCLKPSRWGMANSWTARVRGWGAPSCCSGPKNGG